MPASFLRQLFLAPPARLARYPEAPIAQALAEWRRLESTPPAAEPHTETAGPAASAPALDDDTLAQLATHLWRARQRLGDPEADPATRRAVRHIESATDTLARLQVVTKDWLQQSYDPGLPLRVITFQPAPGITRDTIIEVIRPAVFREDRLLQPAEVVVGTPEAVAAPSGSAAHA